MNKFGCGKRIPATKMEIAMEYSDIEVVLNNMKPGPRFIFGLKYLWHTAKSKVTGNDTASAFLQTECKRQSELLRRMDAGDFQL